MNLTNHPKLLNPKIGIFAKISMEAYRNYLKVPRKMRGALISHWLETFHVKQEDLTTINQTNGEPNE